MGRGMDYRFSIDNFGLLIGKRKKWDCRKTNCGEVAGKEKSGEINGVRLRHSTKILIPES